MRQRIFMTPAVIEEHAQKESGCQNREQQRLCSLYSVFEVEVGQKPASAVRFADFALTGFRPT